jgi:hypothetical protein
MSAVVLNQQGYTNQLYADSLLTGAGGVVCQKGGAGVNANGPVNALTSITVADADPGGVARTQAATFTTYASSVATGGLNPNWLQKFATGDPRVTGASEEQQYEAGYWAPIATAFSPPALAVDTTFVNRSVNSLPLDWGTPLTGTFTTNSAAPVVIPCVGITAGSGVRVMLVGGSAAAFTTAAASGLTPPVITIQVGASSGVSTFTVAPSTTGFIYNYEVLRA